MEVKGKIPAPYSEYELCLVDVLVFAHATNHRVFTSFIIIWQRPAKPMVVWQDILF